MTHFLGLDATAWAAISAISAGLTVVVAAVAASFGFRQIREARHLRVAQARPFVVVDFDVDWLTYISIRNTGQTAAYAVSVRFTPELTSTLPKPWAWEESSIFSSEIPLLAPGREIRLLFDGVSQRFDSKLPLRYGVVVAYSGPHAASGPWKDEYELDLRVYLGTPPKPPDLAELHKVASEMQKTFKSWTSHLNGLRVYSIDGDAYDQTLVERRNARFATPDHDGKKTENSGETGYDE